MSDAQTVEILPLGPIPLADDDAVFTTLHAALGPHLRRLPDGQTEDRRDDIGWQYGRLAGNRALEVANDAPALTIPSAGGGSTSYPRLRPRSGITPADLSLDLGYGEAAKSYVHFAGLKRTGRLAPDTRFLVTLPSATSVAAMFIAPGHRADFVEAYERALLQEIDVLAGAITHSELAIQFDLQAEAWLAANPAVYWQDDAIADEVARVIRLVKEVPDLVELGFRIRLAPPAPVDRGNGKAADDALVVTLANSLAGHAGRPVQWITLPFGADHNAPADFAALDELHTGADCTPVLAIVRPDASVEQNRARIDAAAAHLPAYGLTTEQDWDSVGDAGLTDLLQLLTALARPAE